MDFDLILNRFFIDFGVIWRSKRTFENLSKFDRLSEAIFIDLGWIWRSQTPPKSAQKSVKIVFLSLLGRKPHPGGPRRAAGIDFGVPRNGISKIFEVREKDFR